MKERTKRADQIASLTDKILKNLLRSSRVIEKARADVNAPTPNGFVLPLSLPGPGVGFLIEDSTW